jgi:hypothetical protein
MIPAYNYFKKKSNRKGGANDAEELFVSLRKVYVAVIPIPQNLPTECIGGGS